MNDTGRIIKINQIWADVKFLPNVQVYLELASQVKNQKLHKYFMVFHIINLVSW